MKFLLESEITSNCIQSIFKNGCYNIVLECNPNLTLTTEDRIDVGDLVKMFTLMAKNPRFKKTILVVVKEAKPEFADPETLRNSLVALRDYMLDLNRRGIERPTAETVAKINSCLYEKFPRV